MNTQQHERMHGAASAFSSILMHATEAGGQVDLAWLDQGREQALSRAVPSDAGNNSNRNLSSILTRIQDDGPAVALADDAVHLSCVKAASRPDRTATATASDDSAVKPNVGTAASSAAAELNVTAAMADGARKPASGVLARNPWQQLVILLVLVVIGVLCVSVYVLVDQADDIVQALQQQGEAVIATTETQPPAAEILPLVTRLNQELEALKGELQTLRSEYRDAESRLSMKIPDDLAEQLSRITTVAADNGAGLYDNLELIQREMTELKKTMNVVREDTVTTPAVAGDWIVNLASLSSRDKAQTAVSRLQASGVVPVIQEAVVNGEKVYRLSVAGFITRGDATVFINKARKELGFEGGWIRRG